MRKRMKWIALLVSGALVLGGCSAMEDTDILPDNIQEAVDSVRETAESDREEEAEAVGNNQETVESDRVEKPDAVTDSTREVAENVGFPVITISREREEWYMEDNTTLLLEASKSRVSVENDGFENLKVALEENFGPIDKESCDELAAMAKEHYDILDEIEREYFWGYFVNETTELTRCDSSVVSLKTVYSSYTGPSQPSYEGFDIIGQNFDAESGKELELADILKDAEAFYPKAMSYITERLYEEYGEELFLDYKESVQKSLLEGGNVSWYLDAAGIVFVYSPYILGPYAMGTPEVLLPYSRYEDYIDTKYLCAQKEMVASVPANQDVSTFLGESESIMIETYIDEWEMLSVKIASDTSAAELGSFGWFCDAYVIKRADGRSFVIVVCDYMSDDYVTVVYEVTDGVVRESCNLSGASLAKDYMTTERLGMLMRLDVLGTYNARMDYILDEEGRLIQAEEIFTINGMSEMTVIKELPVTIDGVETTLGVGSRIVMTGTNNVDEVYIRVVGSEQTGTIHYTLDESDSWIHMIDGISEYEYFDMLPYAG